MSAVIDTTHSATDHSNDHEHHGAPTGIKRWIFSTNHKDIGTMYLIFSFLMFLFGGAMALVIRAELFMPGLQLVEPAFFNQMTTMHGLVMVFGAVMPSMSLPSYGELLIDLAIITKPTFLRPSSIV